MPTQTNITDLKKTHLHLPVRRNTTLLYCILSFKSLNTKSRNTLPKQNRVLRNVNTRELKYGRPVHHVPRFHSFPLTGTLQTVGILTPSLTLSLPVAF